MASAVEPGVYSSVDPEQLLRLRQQHASMLEENRTSAAQWISNRAEYIKLKERLSTLPDKPTHEAMIPVGKKAFMRGTLLHTNEVMVLLGDNWFSVRSCKQAEAICDRRIAKCDDRIESLAKEKALVESWKREADNLESSASGEGNLEIREPFDEDAERAWRQSHAESVRKSRQFTESSSQPISDEDLWQRLDELEVEEELDEHLAKEAEASEQQEEAGSETRPLGVEREYAHILEANENTERKSIRKKVSFDSEVHSEFVDKNAASLGVIEFLHSQVEPPKPTPDPFGGQSALGPADLVGLVSDSKPKSIIKPFDASSLAVDPDRLPEEVAPRREVTVRAPEVDPVGELVVEKDVSMAFVPPPAAQQSGRKESAFKKSRRLK